MKYIRYDNLDEKILYEKLNNGLEVFIMRKEDFNSEGDYDTYCTMLRISRSMKYALKDQEKTLLTKQTQLIQEAVSIKTTEYKDAEPGTI